MTVTYHAPLPPRRGPTADADVVMDDGTVIRTTVTSSASDVVTFLREVQERFRQEVQREYEGLKDGQEPHGQDLEEGHHCLIVGLDTEWRKYYENGKSRFQVAVLQLCVADRCLVFQICHADFIPADLEDFLANRDFCFVAVGVGGDVKRLREDCDLEVANTIDLPQVAAAVLGRPELRRAGLKTLAREVMDTLIEKPEEVTMSKWAELHLSKEQISYACIDAFLSFDVGRRLLCKPCRSSI
ncbi:hypothetical protein ACQ4PT_056220 [Festuca glaucescens]